MTIQMKRKGTKKFYGNKRKNNVGYHNDKNNNHVNWCLYIISYNIFH